MATLRTQSGQPQTPQASHGTYRLLAGILQYVLLTLAILFVVAYAVLACQRMAYPYELEWMEGGMVDHVRWILAGKPLYVEPSVEFTPFIYGPLYFYLGAGLSKILGVGFFPLRLISFVSSLGCFWLIGRIVRKETNSWTWAMVSVGLFAATYRMTGAWMDLARVDSLFLLLALAAIYLLRFRTDTRSMIAAGLLLGLSFLTKQAALFISLPLIVFTLLACRGWARYAFAGTFVLFLAGTTQLFDTLTGGWYRYYIFDLPSQHPFLQIMAFGFWWFDIGKNLAVALAMAIFAMILKPLVWPRRDFAFYTCLMLGMMGTSYFARLHSGGYDNVLLPACAFLAICFSLGATGLQSAAQSAGESRTTPGGTLPLHSALLAALYLVGIWQLLILAYYPDQQVPKRRDERAGNAMIQALRSLDGDLFAPDHGFLHAMAGRNTFHAHSMALCDVLRGDNEKIGDKLQDEIRQAIQGRKYEVLVVDEFPEATSSFMADLAQKLGIRVSEAMGPSLLDLFKSDIDAHYQCIGPVFPKRDVFWPVTGLTTRPGWIYVRKDSPLARAALSQPASESPPSRP